MLSRLFFLFQGSRNQLWTGFNINTNQLCELAQFSATVLVFIIIFWFYSNIAYCALFRLIQSFHCKIFIWWLITIQLLTKSNVVKRLICHWKATSTSWGRCRCQAWIASCTILVERHIFNFNRMIVLCICPFLSLIYESLGWQVFKEGTQYQLHFRLKINIP